MTGKELWNIAQAHANRHLSGDGEFTRRCHEWLEDRIGCAKALMTHSCTGAMEMAAILADFQPGDEVIMPSYTFPSTATAFVLRGAVPVFVEIRGDTLNIDETKIAEAITSRTKVIVPVHYGGVGCEMDAIMKIAEEHSLVVVEDAAHGIMSNYRARPLGSIGHLGALSFHETKNVIAGEGGALLINDPTYIERAEIIREKGTNRAQFFRGEVEKYTWIDIGSSYLPSEIVSAFLCAQLEEVDSITERRLKIWGEYHRGLESLEERGELRRPIVPRHCKINGHMYHILLPSGRQRDALMDHMVSRDIGTVSHYVPLHSSPAGKKYGRAHGDLKLTEEISRRVLRLPLWVGLESTREIIATVEAYLATVRSSSHAPAAVLADTASDS